MFAPVSEASNRGAVGRAATESSRRTESWQDRISPQDRIMQNVVSRDGLGSQAAGVVRAAGSWREETARQLDDGGVVLASFCLEGPDGILKVSADSVLR